MKAQATEDIVETFQSAAVSTRAEKSSIASIDLIHQHYPSLSPDMMRRIGAGFTKNFCIKHGLAARMRSRVGSVAVAIPSSLQAVFAEQLRLYMEHKCEWFSWIGGVLAVVS